MIDLNTPPAETVMEPQILALGRTYALALVDFVADVTSLAEVAEELREITRLVRQTPGCREFFAGAMMNREQRKAMVERIFAGRVSKTLEKLLGVMAVNGRVGLIETVSWELEKIIAQRAGRIDVSVTAAVELSEKELQQLRQILAEALGAEPILHTAVDEELIGGLVVKVGDTVYDGSVVGELDRMIESMTN